MFQQNEQYICISIVKCDTIVSLPYTSPFYIRQYNIGLTHIYKKVVKTPGIVLGIFGIINNFPHIYIQNHVLG